MITSIIARKSIMMCIFSIFRYVDETRSTLMFAKRAKLVKTNAKTNEIMDDAYLIKKCKREIEILKTENENLKVNQSSNIYFT